MSWKYVRLALDTDLPRRERLVLIELADCARGQSDIVWPGIERLRSKTKYDESQVRRALSNLIKWRYIEVAEPSKRGKTVRYRLLMRRNEGALCPPNETNEQALCPPNETNEQALCLNEGALCLPPIMTARAVLTDQRISKEEEKDIHTSVTDTRSEIPSEPAPVEDEDVVCEDEEQSSDEDEDIDLTQAARCQFRDPHTPCHHEVEAMATLTELFAARPSLEPPERHINLHWFIHKFSIQDLIILAKDRLANESNDDFLEVATMLSRHGKAERDLNKARRRLEEEKAKTQAKVCRHEAPDILLLRDSDAFTCKRCNAPLSDQEAQARGVSREDFVYDASEMLAALSEKLGLRFSA